MLTIYREVLPACDICKASNLTVVYDMPYQQGHWANVCEKCRPTASNPDHPSGHKMVLGKHPDADQAPTTKDKMHDKELKHAQKLSDKKLEKMMFDSVVTCCDGCRVEPDGQCPHGYRSPLIVLGIM